MRRRIWRGWILCLCACLLLCGAASGTGSTPPDAVSRGAFADALYDAHVAHGGAPVVSEGSSAPFRDVGSWSPYFEALCWAKASGIAGGYAGGAFRPAAPVTRQQATVMLYRYAKTTDLPLEKGATGIWPDTGTWIPSQPGVGRLSNGPCGTACGSPAAPRSCRRRRTSPGRS